MAVEVPVKHARVRGCDGKRRYPNEAMARQQARKVRALIHEAMNHYFCTSCWGWHIGHKPGSKKRRRR